MTILLEQEVKFRLGSKAQAERFVHKLGVEPQTPRHFEVNELYDFFDRRLLERDEAIRLRRVAGDAWLTWKGPQQGSDGIKRRQELESKVSDPDAVDGLLRALGMTVSFRYEKYRACYQLEGAVVTCDETPIGVFVEIEASTARIHELSSELELDMAAAIQLSYPHLYERHRRDEPDAPPFMVFPDNALPDKALKDA